MPFTVQDLIEDKPKPTTITRTDWAQAALELMIDGDYSQLPVVTRDDKAEGMITSDSIVRALNHFDLTIKQMRVSHAITSVTEFRPDDDLFELLDDLKQNYAAVVVDGDRRVIGIVTSYDTTEYFRRRGEDFMLVEDIENMLKDYILAAFLGENGETDKTVLESAICEIAPSNNKLRAPFRQALLRYLEQQNYGSPLDEASVRNAFEEHFNQKQAPKTFEELTLDEYIKLFLSRDRWQHYEPVIGLDPESCRNLLEGVRKTRNELAHFRAELTAQQREELRFCKDWLARNYQDVIDVFSKLSSQEKKSSEEPSVIELEHSTSGANLLDIVKSIKDWQRGAEAFPVQLAKEDGSTEGRYTPLAVYLQSLLDQDKVGLAFKDVEAIIGSELPKYARTHRSWWANDSTSHVQSKQWLEGGWRVSGIDMSNERVTFARIKEREQAYIDFYSELLAALQVRNEMPVKTSGTLGPSWITITGLKPSGVAASIGCSFARGDIFRVELYIDEGIKERNKEIFDELYVQRDEIETQLGETIAWERLDERRASRVAIYHPGTITDDEESLAALRTWAIEVLIKFYRVFREKTEQIQHRVRLKP